MSNSKRRRARKQASKSLYRNTPEYQAVLARLEAENKEREAAKSKPFKRTPIKPLKSRPELPPIGDKSVYYCKPARHGVACVDEFGVVAWIK